MKSQTHLEVWQTDGTILHESDGDAAPFPLKVGEQMMFGKDSYQVLEIIDTDPREENGTMYYRRIGRLK